MEYTKIYNQIIERAQNRKLEGYVEKHHTIPKCMGGLDIQENIVELTAREHFLCHRLLCEIHPTQIKLWYALWLMAIGKNKQNHLNLYKLSSRNYEKLKIEFIGRIKGIPKPSNKGRKITWGDKISKSLKGKPKPQGFNINNPNLKGRLINNKPILQYTLEGIFVKEWVSAEDAGRTLNFSASSINACCRKKTKSSFKYFWKFKE